MEKKGDEDLALLLKVKTLDMVTSTEHQHRSGYSFLQEEEIIQQLICPQTRLEHLYYEYKCKSCLT